MARKSKQSSPKEATLASKILRRPGAPKEEKSLAGSVLSQAKPHPKPKGK